MGNTDVDCLVARVCASICWTKEGEQLGSLLVIESTHGIKILARSLTLPFHNEYPALRLGSLFQWLIRSQEAGGRVWGAPKSILPQHLVAVSLSCFVCMLAFFPKALLRTRNDRITRERRSHRSLFVDFQKVASVRTNSGFRES